MRLNVVFERKGVAILDLNAISRLDDPDPFYKCDSPPGKVPAIPLEYQTRFMLRPQIEVLRQVGYGKRKGIEGVDACVAMLLGLADPVGRQSNPRSNVSGKYQIGLADGADAGTDTAVGSEIAL